MGNAKFSCLWRNNIAQVGMQTIAYSDGFNGLSSSPSSDSVNTFVERSRLESGQFIGPRILTSGTVVFAGTWTGLYEEIVNDDQARAALNRIKAEGGPWALSYKNYQLPSR